MTELKQDVFEKHDADWIFAAVDILNRLYLFDALPKFNDGYWQPRKYGKMKWLGYAAGIKDKQNSLIERDSSPWLTGQAAAKKSAADPVNNPKHYTSHPSGVECIQVTEHMGFNLGNAVKYIWRCDLKNDAPIEDLEKAIWYIRREIARRAQP